MVEAGGLGYNVLFSTKNWPYLGNGKRYGYGYYLSLTESAIGLHPFRWNKNHRPWM